MIEPCQHPRTVVVPTPCGVEQAFPEGRLKAVALIFERTETRQAMRWCPDCRELLPVGEEMGE